MSNTSLAVIFCSMLSCVTKSYLWVLFLNFDAVFVLLMAEAIVHHVVTLSDSELSCLKHFH